jgi:hypothetical protein
MDKLIQIILNSISPHAITVPIIQVLESLALFVPQLEKCKYFRQNRRNFPYPKDPLSGATACALRQFGMSVRVAAPNAKKP